MEEALDLSFDRLLRMMMMMMIYIYIYIYILLKKRNVKPYTMLKEKEQDTSGNLQKVVLEIHGWLDCRNLNILVCQVSKHTKASRLMSHVTLCALCGQTLISRPLPCALPGV